MSNIPDESPELQEHKHTVVGGRWVFCSEPLCQLCALTLAIRMRELSGSTRWQAASPRKVDPS